MHDGGTLWRYLWRLTFSEKAVCDDEHPNTHRLNSFCGTQMARRSRLRRAALATLASLVSRQ